MDYDGDGVKDLLVSCPDRPYKGLYFFKNIGTPRHPRFAAAERISEKGMNNIRLSEVDGKPYVLSKNFEYPDFFKAPYAKKRRLHYEGVSSAPPTTSRGAICGTTSTGTATATRISS